MGFGPQVADLNGDGHRDILSGSWPGEIYFFAGGEDGVYEESVKLQDSTGKAINVGQASAVALHDWDGDGDLDLLIGDIEGDITLLPNLGGEGVPRFGEASIIKAAGADIRVGGDAGPLVVDWDGDGKADLLTGDGKGAVWFFRNTGRDDKGLPILAKGVEIIPGFSQEEQMAMYSDGEADPDGVKVKRPGFRSKIHAADWNGDGRLDLLVGDFQSTSGAQPDVTEEMIAQRDSLQERQQEIMPRYREGWEQLDKLLRERLGLGPNEQMTDEQQQKWGSLYGEVSKEVEGFEAIQQEMQEIWQELAKYQQPRFNHGWVWVYLRKVPEKAASEGVDEQAMRDPHR